MEFGTIIHRLIEEHSRKPRLRQFNSFLTSWVRNKYASLSPDDFSEQFKLAKVALIIFEQYIKHYADIKHKYFAQEQVFREKYVLPSGRSLIIRGRMDEIIQHPSGLLLQENKTKSRFSWDVVKATLPKNMQTMFYCTAIQAKYRTSPIGVLYNVIRKPGIKQKQKESDQAFLERIKAEVAENPDHYFYRHEYIFSESDLHEWQCRTLNPNLESLCLWWESIKANPTNRWATPSGEVNVHHYERPFGVYEPMTNGKGEFFDLIVNKNPRNLVRVETLFPELEDDEEESD
jgi:hypothetical protein